jgi:hypothetical protein
MFRQSASATYPTMLTKVRVGPDISASLLLGGL